LSLIALGNREEYYTGLAHSRSAARRGHSEHCIMLAHKEQEVADHERRQHHVRQRNSETESPPLEELPGYRQLLRVVINGRFHVAKPGPCN